ncbi:hypothetical protein TNIN_107861 [Trichonephila inaurata madagascariensis]|uniref:Uncharacterized protein n=1 Tax=Trichonephila inaurata madagascariensis TaxID=2747483 RepID=A0A8X6YNA8_9ARAC|nr:hypothetical protein TNIN_107861 [Trichonephila inaurata madagascariensis]
MPCLPFLFFCALKRGQSNTQHLFRFHGNRKKNFGKRKFSPFPVQSNDRHKFSLPFPPPPRKKDGDGPDDSSFHCSRHDIHCAGLQIGRSSHPFGDSSLK